MKVQRAPWKVKRSSFASPEMVGAVIDLISLVEFDRLPAGTVLWNIFGQRFVKDTDPIDDDTRGGMMAVGHLARVEDRAAAKLAGAEMQVYEIEI